MWMYIWQEKRLTNRFKCENIRTWRSYLQKKGNTTIKDIYQESSCIK